MVPWGKVKRASIFWGEIRPRESKPRSKFVLVEMKPRYLRLRKGHITHMCLIKSTMVEWSEYCTFVCVCVCVYIYIYIYIVLMEIVWMLKDKKEVMLLLLSNTFTRTKFSCVTMNTQNQDPPPMQAQLSLTVSNNYFYPSQVTLKNFQPKVGK